MTEVASIKPAVTIKDARIACGIEIAVKYLRTFEPYTARFQCRNRLAIFVTYFHIVIPEYNADAFLRDIHAAAAESRIGYNLSECFCHPYRKSTRLNSCHVAISYDVFCLINISRRKYEK